MPKTIILLAIVLCSSLSFGFRPSIPAQTFDSLFDAVTLHYGGDALSVLNAELTGTLSSEDGKDTPFVFTSQKGSLRFELQKATGTEITIRKGGRIQRKVGTTTGFVNRGPQSLSPLNFSPMFTLLSFKSDPRYRGSLVFSKDGTLGLSFLEGTPPGAWSPPFPQPHLIVTFWIDSAFKITSTSYAFDQGISPLISYLYYYDKTVAGPFFHPSRIEHLSQSRLLWTAQISTIRKDLTLATDFFKILELRERNRP